MKEEVLDKLLSEFGVTRDLVISECQRIGLRNNTIGLIIWGLILVGSIIMLVYANEIVRKHDKLTEDLKFGLNITAACLLVFSIPFFILSFKDLINWASYPTGMTVRLLLGQL